MSKNVLGLDSYAESERATGFFKANPILDLISSGTLEINPEIILEAIDAYILIVTVEDTIEDKAGVDEQKKLIRNFLKANISEKKYEYVFPELFIAILNDKDFDQDFFIDYVNVFLSNTRSDKKVEAIEYIINHCFIKQRQDLVQKILDSVENSEIKQLFVRELLSKYNSPNYIWDPSLDSTLKTIVESIENTNSELENAQNLLIKIALSRKLNSARNFISLFESEEIKQSLQAYFNELLFKINDSEI